MLTKTAETSPSSRRVGTMLNTIAVRTKLIPRDPRSIVYTQKMNQNRLITGKIICGS